MSNDLELTEISDLAKQLQDKMDSTVITVDMLANLIENRKISELQSLFNEDTQKKQAYRMFYYYNDRGWKQPSADEEIVYKDIDKLVVRAKSGYNQYHESVYHAVWVLGISEAQVWIHRLNWMRDFEDEDFVWTNEYIRKQMGFNEDISENTVFEKNRVIRIQGDLTIVQLRTYQDVYDERKGHAISEIMDEFKDKILDRFYSEIHQKKRELDADIGFLESMKEKKKRSKEEQARVKELREKYHFPKATFSTIIDYIKSRHSEINWDILQREKDKEYYKQEKEEWINSHLGTFKIERDKEKQYNLRVGNHLVLIEKAESVGNAILVHESTNAFFIHDEHMNAKAILPPGMYGIRLLQRHVTDRR